MVRRDVAPAHLQAMGHRGLQAGLMTVGAGIDTVLHIGHGIHGNPSRLTLSKNLMVGGRERGLCALTLFMDCDLISKRYQFETADYLSGGLSGTIAGLI